MSTFGEYVDGKTIAVVGPAPAPYDQTAEVNAHDIVYRASYGFTVPEDPSVRIQSMTDSGLDWFRSKAFIDGYGTRVDMAFYNTGVTHQAIRGELDHVLVDLDWAVFKSAGMPPSGLTDVRRCNRPPMSVPGKENQLTAMLWDLTFYRPQAVTVFGADFYTSAVEEWYSPDYIPAELMGDTSQMLENVKSIAWHDQVDNRRICQMVYECGWLAGDDRFLKALHMTYEEHTAILEAQLKRAEQVHTL